MDERAAPYQRAREVRFPSELPLGPVGEVRRTAPWERLTD